ncbi:MAG: hypothetical protein FWC40_06500 [Proteobacteria bacterium]|nr:hypothetical protein [Pseudomonadota bacterium]
MTQHRLARWSFTLVMVSMIAAFPACKKKDTQMVDSSPSSNAQVSGGTTETSVDLSQLDRTAFNRAALRLNLPIFWKYEATPNGTVRPEVLTTLSFYPDSDTFVWKNPDGTFSEAFLEAYQKMVTIMADPMLGAVLDDAEKRRRLAVAEELDQAAVVVLESDFRHASPEEQAFVRAMLKAGSLIDALYEKQVGLTDALHDIPQDDVMSRSMARRNWGIVPESPKMKHDQICRAMAGKDKLPVSVYPEELQADPDFCARLEAHPLAESLLSPFSAVIQEGDDLKSIPYHEFYQQDMTAISNALKEAAQILDGNVGEEKLRSYLLAAAESFLTNQWEPADEAWASMNARNSSWYVRVAPDETYWEPCSRKAGFHQTFARINPDAIAWQEKLGPVQQEMEDRLAAVAGSPYVARHVSFQLPDFVDIIANSGDDRNPFGATIGQSLPNWGPVANEGRGRTVAMSNLYTDPDSVRDRGVRAASVFTAKDIVWLDDVQVPGLLGTIIHEACHNLGPSHEYEVDGKIDDVIFGGGLATLAEELKAQTGAMWYLDFLVEKGIISRELANESYADAILWSFGHISRGMTTAQGQIQPYSQLAAIQLGMLLEDGAVTFDPEALAANGEDRGAFILHMEKMPASVERIMKEIARIKATGDKAALVELQQKHVYGSAVPFDLIRERMLRLPRASFVYSIHLDDEA